MIGGIIRMRESTDFLNLFDPRDPDDNILVELCVETLDKGDLLIDPCLEGALVKEGFPVKILDGLLGAYEREVVESEAVSLVVPENRLLFLLIFLFLFLLLQLLFRLLRLALTQNINH